MHSRLKVIAIVRVCIWVCVGVPFTDNNCIQLNSRLCKILNYFHDLNGISNAVLDHSLAQSHILLILCICVQIYSLILMLSKRELVYSNGLIYIDWWIKGLLLFDYNKEAFEFVSLYYLENYRCLTWNLEILRSSTLRLI